MSFMNRRMLKKLGITPLNEVAIRRKVKVRMPDGAELLTDLYLANSTSSAPVILMRSPYGRGLMAGGSIYALASQGFNVVMQSCRGTFGSTGKFDPHHDEQRDGLATIEWIKQQPWYGGSLATFGMSYLGYTQWALVAAAGPEVKAMAMQVTLSDFAQMTYAGNSFMLENAFSWTRLVSTLRKGVFVFLVRQLLGLQKTRAAQWRTLPLASMDEKIIGERVPFWQDWMQHDSMDDPWWAPMSFRNTVDTLQRPISMVAGWYDIFLPWQMRDFVGLQKAGGDTRMTIGPWRHADLDLMNAGLHDAIDWFNHHLLGKKMAPREKRVKLYVLGAEEWRWFDAWPPREAAAEHWYLWPQKQLSNQAATASGADQYRYDPAEPTPSVGGPALETAPFAVDNSVLEARPDVLTYTSAPLQQPYNIIGAVAAELFVTSSASSADFFVRLCDVDANGVSKNICDGLQRVRLVSAGSPQQVRIELWPTAYRIAPGHRIRVQISSGAFPRWARNPGTNDPLGQATTLRSATQSVYHSPDCPSAIILPIVKSM